MLSNLTRQREFKDISMLIELSLCINYIYKGSFSINFCNKDCQLYILCRCWILWVLLCNKMSMISGFIVPCLSFVKLAEPHVPSGERTEPVNVEDFTFNKVRNALSL